MEDKDAIVPPGQGNADLEKFKRKLIRIVSRKLLESKDEPDKEFWDKLKKETKCECKWLWERMRKLTLKRLKRLLLADDRQGNIAKIARMSLTDWLLFDCVLVHENIDVIGMELMHQRKYEPKPLFELFSLVQRFDIEGLVGADLAAAWTAATCYYNSRGRQCSPMLMQLRWHQLKETTREKFYKFWLLYKGNAKYLADALNHCPTRLQKAVAKRFPHIITKPFVGWQEQIQKRLVIMPEEFELLMKSRNPLPSPNDQDPELIMLEPEIETIDLGVESDSDNEFRDDENSVDSSKALENDEAKDALESIKIKQEPKQIEIEYDVNNIKALENMEIPIERSTSGTQNINDSTTDSEELRITVEDKQKQDKINRIGDERTNNDVEEFTDVKKETVEINDLTEIAYMEDTNNVTEKSKTVINETNDNNDGSSNKIEENVVNETDEDIEKITDLTVNEEPVTMPQITNVFGNVHIADEALAKISDACNEAAAYTKAQTKTINDICEEDIEDDIIQTDFNSKNDKPKHLEKVIDKIELESHSEKVVTKIEIDDDSDSSDLIQTYGFDSADNLKSEPHIKSEPETNVLQSFQDIVPDVTLVDDGIELIDDGIEDDLDECKNRKSDETDSANEEDNEDTPKFDLKLLMEPVVYTRRLDDMNILKNKSFVHVSDTIDICHIIIESKPVSKRSVDKVKKEAGKSSLQGDHKDSDEDVLLYDDNSNESSFEQIPEDNKVHLTSNILQKPKNRNYNPIILCKNPDFNTRLKRLTIGFFSYSRNRQLLNSCKPLTIDVSKTFESKMLNGTLYLKSDPSTKLEDKIKHENETNMEVLQETSVIPSAMPVQSLINYMKNNMDEALQPNSSQNNVIVTSHPTKDDVSLERNKVINLPHIDNVRRINQRLLVAEVSPIQVKTNDESSRPPVQIISSGGDGYKSNDCEHIVKQNDVTGTKNENNTKQIIDNNIMCSNDNQVLESRNDLLLDSKRRFLKERHEKNVQKKFYKSANTPPWIPKEKSYVTWYSASNQVRHDEEFLLTVNTLSKILTVMSENDICLKDGTKKKNQKSSLSFKLNIQRQKELQTKVEEFERRLQLSSNGIGYEHLKKESDKKKGLSGNKESKTNEAAMIANDDAPTKDSEQKDKMPVPKVNIKSNFCCWVSYKRKHPRTKVLHRCEKICTCCCKASKKTENDHYMQKACETIESVVQNSVDLIENDENEVIHNPDTIAAEVTIDSNQSSIQPIKTNVISARSSFDNSVTINSDDSATQNNSEHYSFLVDASVTNSNKTSAKNNPHDTAVKIISSDATTDIRSDDISETIISNEISTKSNSETDSTIIHSNNASTSTVPVVIEYSPNIECPPLISTKASKNPVQNYVIVKNNLKRRRRTIKVPSSCITLSKDRSQKVSLTQHGVHISPVNGYLTIDATKKNSKYKCLPVVAENPSKDKVVYLNSKTIFGNSEEKPIFVGVNKILLTDVKLPRKLPEVPKESMPYLVNSNIPLPKGVSLILMPSGELTCNIEPNVEISSEEITSLSNILGTLQQQINSTVPPAVPNTTSTSMNSEEIVNISDDESNTLKQQDDCILIDPISNEQSQTTEIKTTAPTSIVDNNISEPMEIEDNNVEKSSSLITKNNDLVKSVSSNEKSDTGGRMLQNVISNDEQNRVNNTLVSLLCNEKLNTIDCPLETALSNDESNIVDSPSQTVRSNEKSNIIEIPLQKESNSEEAKSATHDIMNTNTETEKVQNSSVANESHNTVESERNVIEFEQNTDASEHTANIDKRKTLLSDLMEMSGISAEDTQTPAFSESKPLEPLANETGINVPISNEISGAGDSLPPGTITDLPELNPVMSFTELKYACQNNGNFFKLDLETGILSPINVCIKKKNVESPPARTSVSLLPKTVIDLTDEPEINSTPIVNQGEPPHLRSILARKKAEREIRQSGPVKPIKLFRVVRPSLLKNDSQVNVGIQTGNFELSAAEMIQKVKRQRKQKLDQHVSELAVVDSEVVESYEFDDLNEEANNQSTSVNVDSGDSSDDEPLAKKVRRRDNENKDKNINLSEEQGNEQLEASKLDTEMPLSPTEPVVPTEINIPMESTEIPMPAEITMFDDDEEDAEEDCILGV